MPKSDNDSMPIRLNTDLIKIERIIAAYEDTTLKAIIETAIIDHIKAWKRKNKDVPLPGSDEL